MSVLHFLRAVKPVTVGPREFRPSSSSQRYPALRIPLTGRALSWSSDQSPLCLVRRDDQSGGELGRKILQMVSFAVCIPGQLWGRLQLLFYLKGSTCILSRMKPETNSSRSLGFIGSRNIQVDGHLLLLLSRPGHVRLCATHQAPRLTGCPKLCPDYWLMDGLLLGL